MKNLRHDLPAAIVVFLVALPLCLGIALASGTPPITGVIAGIVGAIVVGAISGSQLSVSGPAAGLTAIVVAALATLPSYEVFLSAIILAGVIQILFGSLRLGSVSDYVPNAVIKGMLAGIGVILILKQFPHLVGYDRDFEGEEEFIQPDGETTLSEIAVASGNMMTGAIVIGAVSILILVLFELPAIKKQKWSLWLPAPLVVVFAGTALNAWFGSIAPSLQLQSEHLVELPVFEKWGDLFASLPRPDWSAWNNPKLYTTVITLALVASLESLLSLEASDKMDPLQRISSNNRELIAQGSGNIVSGFLGGLPVTSVIVRSSANINAGARTRMSTIIHGVLLLVALLFFPMVINMIPKSALAAVLIVTGYKLAKISIFKEHYAKGWNQFITLCVTVLVIVFKDLLWGIGVGLVVGQFFMLRSNFKHALTKTIQGDKILILLKSDVSYLSKPRLKSMLVDIQPSANVTIDISECNFIDQDIIDELNAFVFSAKSRNIHLTLNRGVGPMKDVLKQEF